MTPACFVPSILLVALVCSERAHCLLAGKGVTSDCFLNEIALKFQLSEIGFLASVLKKFEKAFASYSWKTQKNGGFEKFQYGVPATQFGKSDPVLST